MSGRFWFYLGALIIIAGLGTTYTANARRFENDQRRLEAAAADADRGRLEEYLKKQTDSYKLVRLALTYQITRPELVEPTALRAFELNQNSRDIAILAAPFSQKAKERILFLDPLYQQALE